MNRSYLRIFIFFLLFTAVYPLFAQSILPAGLTSLADSIRDIFIGPFVRTILVICLAGCAVAYGFNKDNEKMKRNILAIGISIAIIVGAQTIVGAIWSSSSG